jgi:gamma-glutamylcyclotransferase (GGCT)/AIG2-like uncharacterized protein YtfP
MPLLFSYGTLQQQEVQLSLFGRLLQGHSDELVGFEQTIIRIQNRVDTCGRTHNVNVVFNGKNESCVSGTVFEITETELAAADQYEQVDEYQRVSTILASGTNAWLYVYEGSASATS